MSKIKYVELIQNEDKQWFWRLKASNGKIYCFSESYSSRDKAMYTARQIKKWLGDTWVIRDYKSRGDKWH